MHNGHLPAIAQVIHSLNVGGAEVLAARIARRLRHLYRFVFFCLDDLGSLASTLRHEGFPVEFLSRRPGFDWRCSLLLGRLLRRHQIDILHAHQYTPFFYGLLGRLACRRPAILFTEHGRAHPDYPRTKRRIANRLLLESRDRIVGVGRAVRQALVANEGLPAARVGVIYNGTDFAAYRNGVPVRDAVRNELGIGLHDYVVILVARLDPVKDHATALEAMRLLVEKAAQARLLIAGDGPERAAIETLVRNHGLGSQVRTLGLRSDVPRLLKAADAVLLTSRSEGIPLTLLEGMAAGLPVVATDVGGVAEMVKDGETGFLTRPGDAGVIADRLLLLAANPELRRRLGQAGRRRAEMDFSEERMLSAYDRLYQEMLCD